MVSMILYDTEYNECALLKETIKESIAESIDTETELFLCQEYTTFMATLEAKPIEDIGYIDIMGYKGIEAAVKFRKKYSRAHIVLIADSRLSPLSYIRPDIMASSLILRPINHEEIGDSIRAFLRNYFERIHDTDNESYLLETKGNITRLPYGAIDYIEAREKKIFIRMGETEYAEYTTLESAMEKLPDYFIRCHRSYAVNMKKVSSISNSENIIILNNGLTVPVSRGCKCSVKEYMK